MGKNKIRPTNRHHDNSDEKGIAKIAEDKRCRNRKNETFFVGVVAAQIDIFDARDILVARPGQFQMVMYAQRIFSYFRHSRHLYRTERRGTARKFPSCKCGLKCRRTNAFWPQFRVVLCLPTCFGVSLLQVFSPHFWIVLQCNLIRLMDERRVESWENNENK